MSCCTQKRRRVTPTLALAAYELLEDLLAVIIDFYGAKLHDRLREQRACHDQTFERENPIRRSERDCHRITSMDLSGALLT